jgi:arylformamidase
VSSADADRPLSADAARLSREWLDVTLGIAADSVAWAGLRTPDLTFDARIVAGAAVNVGRLDCSLHTGTHADAPFHVSDQGATVDQLDPNLYLGAALVVRVAETGAIGRDAIRIALDAARVSAGAGSGGELPLARLLIATGSPYDGRSFPSAAPFLEAAAVAWLLELGVRLFGIDGPSVDPLDSKTLEAHHRIFEAGGGVLENLGLSDVSPGAYELIAAPIKLAGADAAPVRALLRRV